MDYDDLDELEKNTELIFNERFQAYSFSIDDMDQIQFLKKFKALVNDGDYVTACDLAKMFFSQYILARQKDEQLKLTNKANFNTLKALLKNLKTIEVQGKEEEENE